MKILIEIDTDTQRVVPLALLDSFPEINPSNYDHDDACALNAWGVELILAAAPQHEPVDVSKIEQETAEAIAKFMLNQKYMVLQPTQTYSAQDLCDGKKATVRFLASLIESGKWREYL